MLHLHKQNIKRIIPPVILDLFKKKSQYGFCGNYISWQEAQKHSVGYDAPLIVEKVKNATLQVKNGQAAYERDSVLFHQIQYSWPTLACLLWTASRTNNELHVLDFGGSLGSSYFQNRGFLNHLTTFTWNIVEQEHFVQYGQDLFEDEHLHFFKTVDECLTQNKINVFFTSGTLQYLENPYSFMEKIISTGFPYILIDRTTFLKDTDQITVQNVRPGIYTASYPAWFLNEQRFLALFANTYERISEFNSLAGAIQLKNANAFEKGYIFKKL